MVGKLPKRKTNSRGSPCSKNALTECIAMANAALSVPFLSEDHMRTVMGLLDSTRKAHPTNVALVVLSAECEVTWFDGALDRVIDSLATFQRTLVSIESVPEEDREYVPRLILLLAQFYQMRIAQNVARMDENHHQQLESLGQVDGLSDDVKDVLEEAGNVVELLKRGKELMKQTGEGHVLPHTPFVVDNYCSMCLALVDFYMSPPGCYFPDAMEASESEISDALKASDNQSFAALVAKAKYALALNQMADCANSCVDALSRLGHLEEFDSENLPSREERICLIRVLIELDLEKVEADAEQMEFLANNTVNLCQMVHGEEEDRNLFDILLLMLLASIKYQDAEACEMAMDRLTELEHDLPDTIAEVVAEAQADAKALIATLPEEEGPDQQVL